MIEKLVLCSGFTVIFYERPFIVDFTDKILAINYQIVFGKFGNKQGGGWHRKEKFSDSIQCNIVKKGTSMMSWQKENFRRLNRTGGCQLKDFPLLDSNFHLHLFGKIAA